MAYAWSRYAIQPIDRRERAHHVFHMTEALDAIRLHSISKRFCTSGSGADVLRGLTLQVRAGEIFGVIGVNGSGKTTVLEIIAAAQLPSSGSGTVAGYDLLSQPEQVREAVGYCPANLESFYPRLTGRANLEFFAALRNMSPSEGTSQSRAILELINAVELSDTLFQRYSTGMKQKLSLARALLGSPAIVLLDEPTRSLDPVARREFQDLLRHIVVASRKSAVLVTHNLDEARRICDRVALLENGIITHVWDARNLPAESALALREPAA